MQKKADYLFFRLLLILVATFLATSDAPCLASAKQKISVKRIFDMMEKRTDKIDTLVVDVVLKNELHHKNCSLSIKSPDKFAIEFDDASIQAFFNGKKLWLKIAEIKEVFYHFTDSNSFILSYIPLFNPAKIFTNLTRTTLLSLFDVELVETNMAENKKNQLFTLKFTPKMKAVFKEVFSVGHYYMIFSDEDYLPVRVIEFNPEGLERGRLDVVKYRLNISLSSEHFEFVPPPGYALIPLKVVFAQKLEEVGKFFVNKIGEAAGKMKDTILDWGF
jgi:outer membrane lipoprotein-sorting protein